MTKRLDEEEMIKEDIMIKHKRGRDELDDKDWIERQEKALELKETESGEKKMNGKRRKQC